MYLNDLMNERHIHNNKDENMPVRQEKKAIITTCKIKTSNFFTDLDIMHIFFECSIVRLFRGYWQEYVVHLNTYTINIL